MSWEYIFHFVQWVYFTCFSVWKRVMCTHTLTCTHTTCAGECSFLPNSNPQAPLSLGILQAKILEWVDMSSSRGSSWPRDWTQVSCIVGRFFARYLSHQRSSYILLTLVISTLTKWLVSFILSSKFCPLRLLLFPTNSFLGAHKNRWDALKIALLAASIGQQKRPNVSLWQYPRRHCTTNASNLNKLGNKVLPHLPYSLHLWQLTTTSSSISTTFFRENASTIS